VMVVSDGAGCAVEAGGGVDTGDLVEWGVDTELGAVEVVDDEGREFCMSDGVAGDDDDELGARGAVDCEPGESAVAGVLVCVDVDVVPGARVAVFAVGCGGGGGAGGMATGGWGGGGSDVWGGDATGGCFCVAGANGVGASCVGGADASGVVVCVGGGGAGTGGATRTGLSRSMSATFGSSWLAVRAGDMRGVGGECGCSVLCTCSAYASLTKFTALATAAHVRFIAVHSPIASLIASIAFS